MSETKKNLQCSLKDCGFDEYDSEKYMEYVQEHRTVEQLRLLKRQRKKLMDSLHIAQKRVDIVDFMIRSVRQNENEVSS